ncbi:bacterial alpha-L-rhamnosidase-domain-containing protein [Ilyonectria robusta]|uniref:bacterial alpha-L-rhamnosidase-domain-containing protein n=1 Tax=Ilyonectria robusta TaxID=1079257 RepID=UPI001E8EC6FE|nr:bacterial alpha-L-rhamnosidase-domain-containing protein [Ilyonectria robusta]KAH8666116.1 bacterial alpha-L-rhamnosidase-domain-containing protein [Ilyonectria robusta]
MTTPFALGGARWIWVPAFDDAAAPAQFVSLRKTFQLDQVPERDVLLHVSADTRYRLYLNGHSISFGPCKSYAGRWNYETVNVTPYLTTGLNVLAARVLRFSSSHPGCLSMIRTALPGFILCSDLPRQSINTDESWKAKLDTGVYMADASEWDYRLGPSFLNINERADGELLHRGYAQPEFDDSAWEASIVIKATGKMSPMLDPRRLTPRQIPFLSEDVAKFDGVVTCSGPTSSEEWTALILGEKPLSLASNSTHTVDIEVKALTTGFLDFVCQFDGDIQARPEIELLCSECYEPAFEMGQPRRKGDRTDFRNGTLYGPVDIYKPHVGLNHYSPFWFRTFRYVRITIKTGAEPFVVSRFSYRSTHYPLDVATTIQTSSTLVNNLWDISLNTLKNCLHETYEDCPFYEQNQFSMDSRSQILFTYLLSRDDRLARKTMHEFYASRRDDGLVETHYPNPARCINIPTFSLFWVLMVYDHMVHFGDERLVKEYLGAIDGVLNYFDQRIGELGLVGQFEGDSWAFVDWIDGWITPGKGFLGMAVPPAYYQTGSATFHSLLYAYTLLKASELCKFVGRNDTAKEYVSRQQSIVQAVRGQCFDEATGLFLDGPKAAGQFSQHVQTFAVLSGCLETNDAARELMSKTIARHEEFSMAKASFAMGFYLFRAASEAGIYEESWPTLIQPWQKMISHNLTTWAESESSVRSDCHGWSATPLYEIGTEILGVKQRSREYLKRLGKEGTEIMVAPRRSLVEDISGSVPVGDEEVVLVKWGKGLDMTVEASKGHEVSVTMG